MGTDDEIAAARDAAARARRLLPGVLDPEVRNKMLAFAIELEAQAAALEQAKLTPSEAPRVTQVQMPVQQQSGSPGEKPPVDDDPASKGSRQA